MAKFKKGNPGGPGRPKGGRRVTIELLDNMFAQSENQAKFLEALQVEFDKDPLKCWTTYGMPLVPKNIELSGLEGNAIEIDHMVSDAMLLEIAMEGEE